MLSVDPNEAIARSDEDVARRWLTVFPGALSQTDDEQQKEWIALALLGNPERP